MRLFLPLLGLALTLTACDLPDIGDSDSTTSGGGPGPGSVTDSSTTVATSSPPTDTATPSETAAGECPPFDPGPVGDPDEFYAYDCLCESCELSFDDIPLETLQQF